MLVLTTPKYKTIESFVSRNSEYISFSQGAVKVGGTPQIIKDHIRELLKSDLVDYYQNVGGIFPLRVKIAEDLSLKFNRKYIPEQILITHGSIGGITNLCLSLLTNGDQVILPEPTYPSYQNIIKFSKAHPLFVPGFVEEQGGWRLDSERIKEAVTPRTKMVILSNPSNPCGICLKTEDLLSLKNFCEFHRIYLILDEVYDNYIFEGSFSSGTPLVLESSFVVRTGSFSKDFAMSGWRIGYIVAPDSLIPHLMAVQDGTLCCPSVVGQHAALFALEHKELIENQVKIVKNNLALICKMIKPLVEQEILSYIKPEAGIFLFLKTQMSDSERLVMDILDKAKVALVPGKDFGLNKETHRYIRLCFARQEAIVLEGITRILNYFA